MSPDGRRAPSSWTPTASPCNRRSKGRPCCRGPRRWSFPGPTGGPPPTSLAPALCGSASGRSPGWRPSNPSSSLSDALRRRAVRSAHRLGAVGTAGRSRSRPSTTDLLFGARSEGLPGRKGGSARLAWGGLVSQVSALSSGGRPALLCLSVLSSVVGYSIYYTLVGRGPVSGLSVQLYLVPAVSVVGGVLILQERVTLLIATGAVVILAAIALARTSGPEAGLTAQGPAGSTSQRPPATRRPCTRRSLSGSNPRRSPSPLRCGTGRRRPPVRGQQGRERDVREGGRAGSTPGSIASARTATSYYPSQALKAPKGPWAGDRSRGYFR